LFVPFGSIDSAVAQADVMDPGYAVSGDITYGVSRTLVLGLSVQAGFSSGAGALSSTDVTTLAVGPLVRYHLVQGTRFDPWVSFGVAFRRTTTDASTLTGLDWAHLQLGGDWYAGSQVGFGPLLELSLGSFVDSTGPLADGAINAHFLLGGRLVFDTPGK
jgi:hypothetical protein